jgi:hypothetical protein
MLLKEIVQLKENIQLPANVVEYIHQHCQPYMQAVGGDLTHLMYRGISNRSTSRAKPTNMSDVYITPGFSQNRKPVSTEQELHDLANRVFVKRLGLPFRNGLFVSGDMSMAKDYGDKVVIIIPIGQFKFCWSKEVDDMVMVLPGPKSGQHYDENVEYFTGKLETYQSTDLRGAIASHHEIMLYCNECLMIHTGIKSAYGEDEDDEEDLF